MPDGVIRRGGVRVGVLSQDDALRPGTSVGTAIVGEVPEHVWASDARVRDIINGLVADLDWQADVATLSGGQRRRVGLAALLTGDWDVLCLDEPTNHLDVEAISWLAAHLKNRWNRSAGGLLVVTHDRWFLDEVANATWEVHDQIVEPFEGGYAAYVLQRVERDRIAAATEAKRQNLMRKELAWLRRGAPARTSKPKFRIDAATQLVEDVPPIRDSLALSRLAITRMGKDAIDLLDVGVRFGEHQVFEHVEWLIAPGERTAILGANGAGKSTLLHVISGVLEPTSGRVKRGRTVRLGVLDQQFSQLATIGDDRVREVLARLQTTFEIDGRELTPAQLLERLGFSRAHLQARVRELSGGQKRRLQFLLVLLDQPNFLILDEPSNDVDTDMLAAMEDLLDSWPGTLLVVSHDRYLLERVTDQQYAIIDGRLRHLPGGIEEFLALRGAAGQRNTNAVFEAGSSQNAPQSSSDAGLSPAQARTLRKEQGTIERQMDNIATQITQIDQQLADHDPSDFMGMAALADRQQQLRDENDALEERWLEVGEQLQG